MSANTRTPFAAPVVDHLSVRVVVDSRHEYFMPKETHRFVDIEHVGGIAERRMSTLAAEWGLSLHLESATAGAKAQYLLDFGYTPEILNRNFSLLEIDASQLNGLILSHGHRDHYGGLEGFVTQHRANMRDDVSLFVGAEDAFRVRWLQGKALRQAGRGAGDGLLGRARPDRAVGADGCPGVLRVERGRSPFFEPFLSSILVRVKM